jgi:hypothetical protein
VFAQMPIFVRCDISPDTLPWRGMLLFCGKVVHGNKSKASSSGERGKFRARDILLQTPFFTEMEMDRLGP